MKHLTEGEIKRQLNNRKGGQYLDFSNAEIKDLDMTGWNLCNVDFSLSVCKNIIFDKACMRGSSIKNALFEDCTFRETDFTNADMCCAALRYCDMTGCNISGANLYAAVLEFAKLDNIIYDENTKWFKFACPEKGAFLAYKKCFNDRLVQLLVPADAKRTSATMPSCRCNKAKVLTIKSFDYKEEYHEAWSLVNENFVYRKGQWVEVNDFNEDRWQDSTTGIHFWMTREEAKAY